MGGGLSTDATGGGRPMKAGEVYSSVGCDRAGVGRSKQFRLYIFVCLIAGSIDRRFVRARSRVNVTRAPMSSRRLGTAVCFGGRLYFRKLFWMEDLELLRRFD